MEFTQLLKPYTKFFKSKPLSEKSSAPITVMILSPHPDDECISGALALRLMHENNAHIVNVAVTLGSNKDRQEERRKELLNACGELEAECLFLSESWAAKAKELKSLIQKYAPQVIIAPHQKDHHPVHIKTAELIRKVLPTLKKEKLILASSEFWGVMKSPNLLLEVPAEILELQMKALTHHVGEVERNPYHLRLPGWMIDNVRRGSEIIGGKGTQAPTMAFGVLYKVELFDGQKLRKPGKLPGFLTSSDDIAKNVQLILEAASGSKTKRK